MTLTHAQIQTENLSVNEQYALITDIQNVPTTVQTLADGTEYVTYGVTPASEAAGERLMAAFAPAIRAAARRTKLKGNEEEAESVALEAFVRCVREYDLTADTPFHHIVPNVMRQAVALADREQYTVTIPETQVARYHRVMHASGNDASVALAAVTLDQQRWLLSREAFMAVHYAVSGSTSLDSATGEDYAHTTAGVAVFESALDVESPEDEVVTREYVRWLFAQVSDRQEGVCRLAYGFRDHNTENLRVMHGYREGEVLDDLQVADCLDMARSTVNRERLKALAAMRTAAEKSLAEE
ncbi:hypothetical protein [Streptomyces sp. NPDC003952]